MHYPTLHTIDQKSVLDLCLYMNRFFVGGAIHAIWTAMFVTAAESNIKEKHGITGGVLCLGERV